MFIKGTNDNVSEFIYIVRSFECATLYFQTLRDGSNGFTPYNFYSENVPAWYLITTLSYAAAFELCIVDHRAAK